MSVVIAKPYLNLLMVAVSFLTYVGFFKLTTHLPEIFLYDGWIYLLFLPAGSKLISIMLFGIWGTIGDVLALFWMATRFFPDVSFGVCFTYAVISGLATYFAIQWVMKLFKIEPDLVNLKGWQLPWISVTGCLIHGVVTITTLTYLDVVDIESLLKNSLAMMMGDFLGIMVIMITFMFFTKIFLKSTANY